MISLLKLIIKKSLYIFGILISFTKYKPNKLISMNKREIFFGYHDKKNILGNKILFHSLKENKKNAEICFKNLDINSKIIKITNTPYWSWQLGSQLQWLGKDQNKIIFNSQKNKKNISTIFNLKKNQVELHINYPIFSLDKTGKYMISINFKNLLKNRKGYGYSYENNSKIFKGFYLINIKSKTYTVNRYVSLKKIKKDVGFKKNSNYYINHLNFSPDKKKIIFFLIKNSKLRRQTNLISYDIQSNISRHYKEIINPSHYCWIENKTLVLTSNTNSNYKYGCLNLNSNKFKLIINNDLKYDGHPMQHPKNKNLILTDTYPNILGYQKLLIIDLKKNRVIWKKNIFSSQKYIGFKRCDLHPRWSSDGKKICIDTTMNGKREIGIINFDYNKINLN